MLGVGLGHDSSTSVGRRKPAKNVRFIRLPRLFDGAAMEFTGFCGAFRQSVTPERATVTAPPVP